MQPLLPWFAKRSERAKPCRCELSKRHCSLADRLGGNYRRGAGPESTCTTDLMAEFYAILREQPDLASIVFGRDASVSRQATGQGCGSLTMTMSDGRLSLFAASMSEYLLARQQDGLPPEGGEVLIGRLSDDGLSLEWLPRPLPAVTVVPTTNGETWRVHVHPRALSKMQEDVARWRDVETGGVLMGRLSEVSRVAHVVDVVEAPEDSRRARDEFVLGTKGTAAADAGVFGDHRLVALLSRNMAQPPLSGRTVRQGPGHSTSGGIGSLDALNLPGHDAYRLSRACGRYIVRR